MRCTAGSVGGIVLLLIVAFNAVWLEGMAGCCCHMELRQHKELDVSMSQTCIQFQDFSRLVLKKIGLEHYVI